MSGFLDFLGPALGLAGGGLLTAGAYDRLGDIGDETNPIYDEASGQWSGPVGQIAQQSADMANFTPFGVTSSLGNIQTQADGSTQFNLSDPQLAQQNQLGQNAMTMFGNAMQDTGAREQDVYDRIRAVQQPEEERQRLALENRLFGQGRSGVTTANYGGTPEQLAMAKAQAEAQNSAALMALQQGQAEQLQQANLGSQFMQQQYAPTANLLSMLQGGTNVAGMADVGRRQSAGMFADALMGGLETSLGARLGQANLMGNLGTGLLQGALTPSQYNPLFGV